MAGQTGLGRRALLGAAVALAAAPARAAGTIRIGYQKYGTLIILKEKGWLEPKLAPLGTTVEWREFTAGPQLLEALNAGALDLGITGETPPIFAQAANPSLVYVGVEPPAPEGEAIIVPKASPITRPADLKGRTVGLNKGSNVHWLLLRALAANGLALGDIQPVYLAPADGRAAFQAGHLDAWAIWDPYLAAAEAALGTRRLLDATGLVPNRQFFLSTRAYVTAQPAVMRVLIEQIGALDRWAAGNPAEVAALLAPATGLPLPVVRTSLDRLTYGIAPITPDIVQGQQRIADAFHEASLVPRAISIRDAVWTPPA